MKLFISHPSGILLFRQLAAATRGNLPYREVLEILSKDPEMFGRDSRMVDALARQLADGTPLSSALQKMPELVAAETAELVKTAEDKGILAQILDVIADDYTELAQRRNSFRGAMTWPLTVLAAAVILVAMMMIFIIPAFKELFSNFGADLPTPTLIIVSISDFVANWLLVIALLITGFVILKRKNKLPRGMVVFFERILLAIPFVRKYLAQAFSARTISWIRIAHKDPQLFLAALRHLRATTSFSLFQRCLSNLEARIASATSLSQVMFDLDHFPRRFALLMQLGERNNDIDGALDQIADFAETERLSKLAGFERWLVLCTYLVLGTSVGLIVIAMYLPIFTMGTVV